jgi:hypothetical protein
MRLVKICAEGDGRDEQREKDKTDRKMDAQTFCFMTRYAHHDRVHGTSADTRGSSTRQFRTTTMHLNHPLVSSLGYCSIQNRRCGKSRERIDATIKQLKARRLADYSPVASVTRPCIPDVSGRPLNGCLLHG